MSAFVYEIVVDDNVPHASQNLQLSLRIETVPVSCRSCRRVGTFIGMPRKLYIRAVSLLLGNDFELLLDPWLSEESVDREGLLGP